MSLNSRLESNKEEEEEVDSSELLMVLTAPGSLISWYTTYPESATVAQNRQPHPTPSLAPRSIKERFSRGTVREWDVDPADEGFLAHNKQRPPMTL